MYNFDSDAALDLTGRRGLPLQLDGLKANRD